MDHVAVDLGSRQSQYCVRSADGQVVKEGKMPTAQLGKLFAQLRPSRVVLETCSEAFAVADMAKLAGHEVSVVPGALAPSLGVGQRGVKTDKRDAQNLSLASCRMEKLPSVHIPSMVAREQRTLMTSRSVLVESRTKLINNVRGWLRVELLRLPSGASSSFTERVREVALHRAAGLPKHIERTLTVIETLSSQIAEADRELETLVKQDPVCIQLMTVPGVGPVTSLTFRAVVDEVSRFPRAHSLESYLGLTPGERSSGETINKGGITGAGSVRTRTALVQAAWVAYRSRPDDPMVQWARELAKRKPVQVAITALARKIAGILHALWRNNTTYDPAYAKA